MGLFYSAVTGGFYDSKIHAETLPDDAVTITSSRHAELIAGQAEGAKIAPDPETGDPVTVWPDPLSRAAAIDLMRLRAKSEAERRIITVSPIFRQLNDLRTAQSGETMSAEAAKRFGKIDEIRTASNAIEAEISALTNSEEILAFDILNHPLWPESN